MFKKGDIVVRTNNKYRPETNFIEANNGFIFKCLRNSHRAYYKQSNSCHENNVRKATENEIKWFEAGITNINQIPEIGGTFDFVDPEYSSQNCKKVINNIDTFNRCITCSTDVYHISVYVEWLKSGNIEKYYPPIKSQHVDNEVPIDTPFEVGDLKNCKIGNLTPEDHRIIQPWLFSLGYQWIFGKKVKNTNGYYLSIKENYIYYGINVNTYNENKTTEIKKETILNYIKQLNTNKDYEQINKKREIKPESRAIRGSSIRIPVITGRITSASRLIGNKASGKCVKSQIRKFKISANIVTC